MVDSAFGFVPDPEKPGWYVRRPREPFRFMDFYGDTWAWALDEKRACIRLTPDDRHLNATDRIHGGFTLGLIDQCLFIGPSAVGVERVFGGSTIDTATQFLAPLKAHRPIDTIVELMRETYRMVFVRGTVDQDGMIAATFRGTLKKASVRP